MLSSSSVRAGLSYRALLGAADCNSWSARGAHSYSYMVEYDASCDEAQATLRIAAALDGLGRRAEVNTRPSLVNT